MVVDIYEKIKNERLAQDKQWGGVEHDDQNDKYDWVEYIRKQLDYIWYSHRDTNSCLIKVAALAIAASESLERKNI